MSKKPAKSPARLSIDSIERRVYLLRGHRVMLDADLSALYQVGTKRLNEAVQRNIARFPDDFMFQLTREEMANLKFQIGTSSLKDVENHDVVNLRSQIATSSLKTISNQQDSDLRSQFAT